MKSLLVLTLTILALPCHAEEDLRSLVNIGVKNSFDVQAQKISLDQSRNSRLNSYFRLLPTVGLSASHSESKTESLTSQGKSMTESTGRSLDLNASWTLWDNYQNIRDITLAELNVEAEEISTDAQIQSYILKFLDAFYSYQLLLGQRKIIESYLEQAKWSEEQAKLLVRAGAGTKVDVLDAEIQVKNSERDLLEINNGIFEAKRNIQFLLNVPIPVELPELALDKNVPYYSQTFIKKSQDYIETWRNRLPRTNPNLRVAKISLERTKESYQQTRLDYFPKLSLNLSHNIDYAGYISEGQPYEETPLNSTSWSLNLTWDMWDWWSTGRNIQNSRMDLEKSQLNFAESHFQAKTEFISLLNQYKVLNNSIETSNLILEKARTQWEQSQELYRLGRLTAIQLRQSRSDFSSARNSLIGRLKQKYMVMARLLYHMGEDLRPSAH